MLIRGSESQHQEGGAKANTRKEDRKPMPTRGKSWHQRRGVEANTDEEEKKGWKPTRRRRRLAAAADSGSGFSAWFFGTENFRAAIQNLGPVIRHRLPDLGPD
jgi:hypothetical protein